MLPREGGFAGTHLWLKSFSGLPQLISHRLVGVLCLGSSVNRQPAAEDAPLPSLPFIVGRAGAKRDPGALVLRFSQGTLQLPI